MPRFTYRLGLLIMLASGCAPMGTPGPRTDSGTGNPGTDAGMSMMGTDSGPVGPGTDAGFMECAAETTTAETGFQPVDVIWIVDSSGSMSGEADIVQMNINRFAADIGTASIDYHVVMITERDFVTVPAPLGTDPTRFLHIEESVGSNEGLSDLITNFAAYESFLRPGASTHFVVVTDDESERLTGMLFRTQMEMNLGHTFTLHAIASPPGSDHCSDPVFCFSRDDGCTGPNGDAADNGDEYWALAMATGGQQLSICTPDWSGLFTTLTAAIAVRTELPCRYFLPEATDGTPVDRMRVNVVYTPSSGTGDQTIPFVGSFGSCTASGGWYYEGDDVVVCPTTCDVLRADDSGEVSIALGCATILI